MRERGGMSSSEPRLTRRQTLLRLAGFAVAAGGVAALERPSSGAAALTEGLAQCVLTPELTEGPYYVAGERIRHDITEGKPGLPLLLSLRVVGASSCRFIRNAAVDVWHCDAGGVYSGAVAQSPGTNFLRGVQRTNAKGVATFKTIYPGWYPGRAVHIHVKVHVRGNVVHTGQLFFPAAITDAVYAKQPYAAHGASPDTANPADAIFRNGGSKGMLALRKTAAGYTASLSMGVHA
jgi:protocatechuate 3,4-dioxygenase beta subunit